MTTGPLSAGLIAHSWEREQKLAVKISQTSSCRWQARDALTGEPIASQGGLDRFVSVDDRRSPQEEQTVASRRGHVLTSSLTKSKKRVADHGEVFTPSWLVEEMLNLVKGETTRIDSRFLEPACGSGNFLVPVLQRKLAAVEASYRKSEFDRQNYALLALMCVYGIELLLDNIVECRARLLKSFSDYLSIDRLSRLYRAGFYVLSQNLVHGDALTMRACDGQPISFAEWGYLGRGKFQRRDFRLDVLTGSSGFTAEDSLFAHLGKHELFTPTKSYPVMTIKELADAC